MVPKIQLINISKTFEGRLEVLSSMELHAGEGEFVCIIGPSGCGKTVLLYLVAGFLQASSGVIMLNDKQVSGPGTDRVMVFQDYVLFPWRTAFENVLFGLENLASSKKDKMDTARNYIDLVGLSAFSDWYPHKLSGGMRQRVAIARALAVDPEVLLMDEPFASIDSQNRKYLRNSLLDIWMKTRKTVLFVTHSINEAVYLADRIYVMSSRPARVLEELSIDMQRPRDQFSSEFIGCYHRIESHLSKEFNTSAAGYNAGMNPGTLFKKETV